MTINSGIIEALKAKMVPGYCCEIIRREGELQLCNVACVTGADHCAQHYDERDYELDCAAKMEESANRTLGDPEVPSDSLAHKLATSKLEKSQAIRDRWN